MEGASCTNICYTIPYLVSIHAPMEGAIIDGIWPVCTIFCFNSRSHGGSDAILISPRIIYLVSIHAPMEGAI